MAATAAMADPIQLAPQPMNPDTFHNYPTTGIISSPAFYTAGGQNWVTSTKPLAFEPASLLAAEGNENPFLQTLNNFGGGWSFDFSKTKTIAGNTFQVHTCQAQGPTPPAGNNLAYRKGADAGSIGDSGCVKSNNCTGAEFYLHYNATGDDPANNVHWIQVIDDGGNFTVDSGIVVTIVNGKPKVVLAPYYDDGEHTADGTGFLDFPSNFDATTPSTFDAELFLVTGPAIENPGLVTIYGAVDWGWSNRPLPEPTSLLLLSGGLPLVVLARRWQKAVQPVRARRHSAGRRSISAADEASSCGSLMGRPSHLDLNPSARPYCWSAVGLVMRYCSRFRSIAPPPVAKRRPGKADQAVDRPLPAPPRRTPRPGG